MNDETKVSEPKAGPPISEVKKDDDAPKGTPHTRGHRFRIRRADGSRFWHIESATDPTTAFALARSRGLGEILSDGEPIDKDGEPIKKKDG